MRELHEPSLYLTVPQVKVASDEADLGSGSGIPKCPSAPDIAHHKLDVSSTGGARVQHLSGGSSRGLSKGAAGQLLGRAATLKSRTPSPRGVSPTATTAGSASCGKQNG